MITDPPILTLRANFQRPAPEMVQLFAGASTGHLVDAMGGAGALDWRIKPLSPDRASFCGVALTCDCGPADNLGMFGALEIIKAGDVLMAATSSYMGTAIAGDLLVGMTRNSGAAAFVTDGAVRDVTGILPVGLPVFCAGVTPNSPVRNGPGTAGLPVVIGGVAVASGDIIVGDSDGVVVVPLTMAAQVLERLQGVRAAEASLEAKVKAGLRMPDFMSELLASDRVERLP
jgi:4-hydroxy-4-methyl-2-oxoglutarate aldolase